MNKKKTVIAMGAIGIAGIGTALILDRLMRKSVRIEREKQMLVEGIRRYMKANKVGTHDLCTELYVEALLLDGKSLSRKEIKELLSRA